jgi:hypothetical protein
LSHIRNVEAAKVAALAPDRYVLATSVDLTVDAKNSLRDLLSPFVRTTGDIYGVAEIASLLRARPHIVRRHMKLWLSSTAILQSLLNRDIEVRSQALREDLDETLRLFVPNDSYGRAADILEQEHVCVIAGPPGIGKSTLAQMLVATHAAEGYEVVDATWDLGDVDRAWSDDVRQVFYVDDFLGQTVLDERRASAASLSLPALLRKVHRSDNKRFVLTTRGYIVAQARERFDKLDYQDFSPLTCTLDISDFGRSAKASILYNHVYFSKLPEETKALFADRRNYSRIVDHPNYNPRVLEHVLLRTDITTQYPTAVDAVIDHLDHPRRIWEHVVENVLDDAEIAVLMCLFSLGNARLDTLEQAWAAYHDDTPAGERTFRRSMKRLEGTMIRLYGERPEYLTVAFSNPSVEDYLRSYLGSNRRILAHLLTTAISFRQVHRMWDSARSGQGQQILYALGELNDILADAALRTVELPSRESEDFLGVDITSNERVNELNLLLQVVEFTGSERLALAVADSLDGLDIYSDSNRDTDIVRLAHAVHDSEFDCIRRLAVEVLEQVIEIITEDLWGWRELRRAEHLLDMLHELAPESARERVRSRLLEEAELYLSPWADDDELPTTSFDEHQLSEVLDWVAGVDTWIPGYSAARDALEVAQSRSFRREMSPRTKRVFDTAGIEVDEMFSTLS